MASATAQIIPFIATPASISAQAEALIAAAFSDMLSVSSSSSSCASSLNVRKGLENLVEGRASVCRVSWIKERG